MSDTKAPSPGASADQIIAYLKSVSARKAADWLQSNAGSISPQALVATNDFISSSDQYRSIGTFLRDPETYGRIVEAAKGNLVPLATKAINDRLEGKTTSVDMSRYDPAAVAAAVDQATQQVAAVQTSKVQAADKTAPAVTPGQVTRAASAAPGTLGSLTGGTPTWLSDVLSQQPGGTGMPTESQKARIADGWNAVYGTHFTYDQLVQQPQFKDATNETQLVVKASVLDAAPVITHNVVMPNGTSVALTTDDNMPGYVNGIPVAQVAQTARYANAFGMKTSAGEVAWQPLLSVMKASGLAALPTTDKTYQQLKATVARLEKLPYKSKQLSDAQQAVRDYERAHPDVVKAAKDYEKQNQVGKIAGLLPLTLPGLSIAKAVQKYNDGMKKYGDPTFAYLFTQDPALAARLFSTGGDIAKVDNRDLLAANQVLAKGGWDVKKLAAQGYAAGNGLEDFLNSMYQKSQKIAQDQKDAEAERRANLPPTRTFTDPAAIKETARSLWQTLFLADPSDKLLNSMAAEIHNMEASAPISDQLTQTNGQDVNIQARLQEMARNTDLYKSLYGKKQAGQTEQDYMGQFQGGVADILGHQTDNESVKAGMMSGQYNTAVQDAAVTGLATNNSTFLGRLAQAAQAVAAYT